MQASLLLLELAGPELTADEIALVRDLQPVGFVLGARNLIGPEQTRRLTDALRNLSRRQPLVALAGHPATLGGIAPTLPTPGALAAHGNAKTIGTAGLLTGELLRMLGINFHFAPVLDLDREPAALEEQLEPGWGRDPQRVIDHAGQWNRWVRKRGVASCAGCFPASGRAATGSEHGFPVVTATLAELLREDLLPYTALMPELDAIRVGHVVASELDADLPASLSPRVIRRLLRDQLGFDHHLVLPDDLAHAEVTRCFGPGPAVRLALEAGNDLVRVGPQPAAVRAAAAALATLPHLILAEAWERVERLRDKLHWPLPWAPGKLAETTAKLAALAGQVSESNAGP
jgi:beta-N-acetylhexosaminidase